MPGRAIGLTLKGIARHWDGPRNLCVAHPFFVRLRLRLGLELRLGCWLIIRLMRMLMLRRRLRLRLSSGLAYA